MTGQPAERTIAVLHRTGDVVRGLIAARRNGRSALIAWEQFEDDRAEPIEDRIDAWLEEHRAAEVIGVLPAAAVVCRTCSLPDADPEHLEQALRLQAEAHLPDTGPEHRQAMAVLPVAPGETNRSGIIVAWPEAARPPLPPTRREMTFAPDVAALAALLNGVRPADPLLSIDRSDGSVALAISHANGAAIRAARGNAESPHAWRESVGRVIAETALSVGHTGAYTESLADAVTGQIPGGEHPEAALVAPPQIIESARVRLDGAPTDPAWWRAYGVAAGAFLARTDQLAPLTQLKAAAPIESPSRMRSLFEALSNPASAAKIVAACLVIVLLGPSTISGLRLWLLKAKLPDLQAHLAEARQAEAQLAMYRELKDKSWPMAKLLSDIACNTPEGIDLDQVRLKHGERISVSGRSKPHGDLSAQEVVALMQENLRQSRIFTDIYHNWGHSDAFGAYEFTLSAKVVRPYHRHPYTPELDFGDWTLGDRMYGTRPTAPEPDATPPAETAAAAEAKPAPVVPPAEPVKEGPPPTVMADSVDESDEGGSDLPLVRLPQERPRFPGQAAGSRADDRATGGPAPPSVNIPEPLTAEQVKLMGLSEAQEARALAARALQRAILDDEDRQRLKKQFRDLQDRIRELMKK
ncbi:MAG: PilN domain-containing protein [Planctomycetota bacterium]